MPELLTEEALQPSLSDLPEWKRTPDGKAITRTYTFMTFMVGMRFVDAVAEIAAELDHHPDIDIRYNQVRLEISTHSAGGLTRLDLVLAAKADEVADDIGLKVEA
jgi:4a-hydroxytetrahydrobiopterin dehydratase